MVVASTSLDKRLQVIHEAIPYLESSNTYYNLKQHDNGPFNCSLGLWNSANKNHDANVNTNASAVWEKKNEKPYHFEYGLFSNSISSIINKNSQTFYGQSANSTTSHYVEEERFDTITESEAHAIETLLPNDDDLFMEVAYGLENHVQPLEEDKIEDFDIFSNIGGMGVENDTLHIKQKIFASSISNEVSSSRPNAGEHRSSNSPNVNSDYDLDVNNRLQYGTNSSTEKRLNNGILCGSLIGLPSLVKDRSFNTPEQAQCENSFGQSIYRLWGPLNSNLFTEYHNTFVNNAPSSLDWVMPYTFDSLTPKWDGNTSLNNMGFSINISKGVDTIQNVDGHLQGSGYNGLDDSHYTTVIGQSPYSLSKLCNHQLQHRFHGYPISSGHVHSTLAINCHHVGSTPAGDLSFKASANAYCFHQNSNENMRISDNNLHHMDFISSTMYRCIHEESRTSLLSSIQPPIKLDNIHMTTRNSNQVDKKRIFELDIARIRMGKDVRTTLMIKNIPNKYTSKMLMAAIDEQHRGTYDFIYLPIDFKNKCNVGYAFINMVDLSYIIPFYETFNGKKWEKFNSEKIASITYARIQGKTALISHFQNSSLMNEDKRCRPIIFNSDGISAGNQVPFPIGVNNRAKSTKSRPNNNCEEPIL